MAAFSQYLKTAILNTMFRNTAFGISPPASVFVALFTVDPGDTGAVGELTGGAAPGYARVELATDTSFSAPASDGNGNHYVENLSGFEFPEATGDWPSPITYFGIFDASTSGHLLFRGPTPARTVTNGMILRFIAGGLKIKIG